MKNPKRAPRIASLMAAFFLGALCVGGFAPLNAFFVIFFSFAGLLALLNRALARTNATAKKCFWNGAALGFSFGLGFFLAGVSWIYVSLATFGGMPAPLAAFATLIFCAGIAIYPALAGGFFTFINYRSPKKPWQNALLFAALWTIFEWLRGFLLTGFSWLSVGYSQAPISPLAGFAPVFGVFGLSFLSLLAAAWLYEVLRWMARRKFARLSHAEERVQIIFPVLMLAVLATGQALKAVTWVAPRGEPFSVALLQGNIPQELKWRPAMFNETLQVYYQLALEHPAELTVLPEAAIPGFFEDIPPDYLVALNSLAKRQAGDIVLGVALKKNAHYFNAAVSLSPPDKDGELRYKKSHLVPFGEFLPPGFSWFMAWLNIPMSGFTPGEKNQTPLAIVGQKLAVNICYEDAFGEEIIRALPQASVLVNLSNIAWFGDSLAPAQHGQISSMRALETGRMMLRATNTGLTAIIGIDGRIISALKPFTRGVLQGNVQGYQGRTPYVRWGNWLAISISFIVLLFLGRRP